MTTGRTVIVYGGDSSWVARAEQALAHMSVLHSRSISDLARVLTSGLDIGAMIAMVEAERDWRVLAIVREGLPTIPIVGIVGVDAGTWQGLEPSPLSHRLSPDDGVDAGIDLVVSLLDGTGVQSPVVDRSADARDSHDPAPIVVTENRESDNADRSTSQHSEQATSDPTSPARRSRTIAVLGAGGGVGTTTIAAALACEIAEDHDVVVVDMDPLHGSLASVLRCNPTYTIDDINGVMHDPESLDDALPMCLVPVLDKLHLIGGPSWSSDRSSADRDIAVIESLARRHDVVVVDLGTRAPSDLAVLAACTDAVVVCSHDIVVAGRLPALGDAVSEFAPFIRHWNVLNTIRAEGPSPSSISSVLGHGWSCEVPWSKRYLRVWNDPLSGIAHRPRRAWKQISRHLTWIVNASDSPASRPSVTVTGATAAALQRTRSFSSPTRTHAPPADAPSEEHTHV